MMEENRCFYSRFLQIRSLHPAFKRNDFFPLSCLKTSFVKRQYTCKEYLKIMITFGFIKEHDKSVPNAISYIDILKGNAVVDKNMISYLKSGETLLSMLHWTEDIETKKPILPHIIRTDGFGIWPDYLAYYLEKGFEIEIPILFLNTIQSNNFSVKKLSDSELKKAIEFYLISTNSKVPMWKK